MADRWIPSRTDPHPPPQVIAVDGATDFLQPEEANGFILGADGLLAVTFDGSDASATHGVVVDPAGKGAAMLFPIQVNGRLSIHNRASTAINVEVAWLEFLGG